MKNFLRLLFVSFLLVFPTARPHAQQSASAAARYAQLVRMLQPGHIPYDASIEDSIRVRLKNTRSENDILSRYGLWQKYFSDAIANEGLPSCLQYLPLALSRMDIHAMDNYGRAGVWRISDLTAARCGIRCDSLVDERFDPQISSQIAAKELKRLLNLYEGNVWECILAYSVSPAAVNALKIRLRDDNPSPWTLQQDTRYFPENILSSFISWMFIFQENGVCPSPQHVNYQILTEKPIYRHQLTELMQCPDEEFVCNNPALTGYRIPSGVPLCFSQAQLSRWNTLKDSLYFLFEHQKVLDSISRAQADSLQQAKDYVQQVQDSLRQVRAAAEKAAGKTVYTVKSGDVLGKIAQKHNVSVADIKRWNNQQSDIIQIGQKLIIYRK